MEQSAIAGVVVASPGDVQAEREAVVRAAEEVTRNLGRDRGLRLEVYRWETDAHPGFHPKGPQGVVDPALRIEGLRLAHRDLLETLWDSHHRRSVGNRARNPAGL